MSQLELCSKMGKFVHINLKLGGRGGDFTRSAAKLILSDAGTVSDCWLSTAESISAFCYLIPSFYGDFPTL